MLTLNAYNVTLFGLHFSFDSVAFTIPIAGGWNVYWYGIMIATGFLLAVIYAFLNYKKFNLDVDRMTDVVIFTTPLSIFCARLYYVIFDGEKLKSFGDFFGLGSSSGVAGLAIYGGIIGAFGFGFLFSKLRKVKFTDMIDLGAVGFLIGQALGRWGNFFNQEAFGSAVPNLGQWGMLSSNVTAKLGPGVTAHPCFFYESVWCILGAVLLHFFVVKKRRFSGEVSLWYGAWYGLGRFFIEGLRTDSLVIKVIAKNIRVSQVLSAALLIACIIILCYKYKKLSEDKESEQYSAIFDDIDDNTLVGTKFYEGEDSEENSVIDEESSDTDSDAAEDNADTANNDTENSANEEDN